MLFPGMSNLRWTHLIPETVLDTAAQSPFDILQQLKSATVHSKTSLREASLYLVGGGAENCRDGKVKVAGI